MNHSRSRLPAVLAAASFLTLTACDGVIDSTYSNSASFTFDSPLGDGPARTIQALEQNQLELDVTVNGESFANVGGIISNDTKSVSISVPDSTDYAIGVRWYLTYQGTRVPLAEATKTVAADALNSVAFLATEYNTSFDNDGDGMSNLEEVKESRSPVDLIDQRFAFLSPSSPIPVERQIQGAPSQQNNTASFVVDSDGFGSAADTLLITVTVQDSNIVTDSIQAFQDDGVEIFIDGNNSKGTSFDGPNGDDFQFFVTSDGLFSVGSQSSSLSASAINTIRNGTSSRILPSGNGYEITFTAPFSALNIEVGRAFGLNIEVNDDDNGGDRDSKLSWIGSEQDISFTNPSNFGTVIIE